MFVNPGMTKTEPDGPGKVLYNRAMWNAALIAEAITVAQEDDRKKRYYW